MTVAGSDAAAPHPPSAARFRVVVGGLEIGRFSRCSGLGLEYEVVDYAEGGEGAFTHRLRGGLRQATLTLSRGVTDETALLDWFFARAEEPDSRTVTIFLLDDAGRPVRHWSFDGASPVRWQGPDLDAGSGAAAVEVLEIAHQGLISSSPGIASPRASPAPTYQRARVEIEGGGEITCWMNPSTYTITQRNDWVAERDAVSDEPVVGFDAAGSQELEIELLFDATDVPGRSVTDVCTALFGAMQPLSSGTATDGDGDHRRPPILTFMWGDTPPFRAVARRMKVRYLLFRADGEPSRATIELTLVRTETPRSLGRARRPGLLPGQEDDGANARPGAGDHVVKSAETLPLIAHRYYRDAHAWRVIAESNDVDDPTRLVPGTRLHIPPFRRSPKEDPRVVDPSPPERVRDGAGGGVAFPLRVDAGGGIRLVRGADDVRESIGLVLSTEPGERTLAPEFGCALQQFLFERLDAATLGRVREEILRALGRWEARIDVLDVGCDVDDSRAGMLAIQITYVVTGEREVRRLVHRLPVLPTEETADAA